MKKTIFLNFIKKIINIEKNKKKDKMVISNFEELIDSKHEKDDIIIEMPKEIIKKEYILPNVDMLIDENLKKIISMIKENNTDLCIPIGTYDENILIEKIENLPNLLVGGTIMSGKTTYINSIIMSILFTKKPDELKMIIYDSKGIDYSDYKEIPHLITPIINDRIKFRKAITRIGQEVQERYEILKKENFKSIIEYNKNIVEKAKNIPDILIIIDDYISLSNDDEINSCIEYISKNGWKVNVYLIVVANHPSSRIIPTVSKANFPSRISFKVISKKDSVMILDESGAEKLKEFGTALYKSNHSNEMKKIKIPFFDEDKIRKTVEYCTRQQKAKFDNTTQMNKNGIRYTTSLELEEEPLYNEIVEFVATQGKASASLLQRRFHLGYNRAAHCIDLLEERGIIGPNNGSKPREVLVKLEEKN